MKILFLAHRLPWPLHDGYNLHNYHYTSRLSDRHEFHLVAVDSGEFPPDVARHFASVRVVPPMAPPVRTTWSRLRDAVDVDQVFEFDPAVVEAAREVLAEVDIEAVWTAGAKMLVYSRALPGLPVLGDIADEAMKEALHDLRTARSPVALARAAKNALNTWRFQRRYLEHTTIATVVSEVDRDMLARNCPDLEVRVIPNGVDTAYFRPSGEPEDGPSLVFEGAMDFRPNAEGIVAFCRDTLPRIRAARPDVRLLVVGKDPVPEVEALQGPGVTVTGFVDDVRPWLERASVFVCPLRRGAGIKNKILQAWAMERPVVATSISCGGLDVRPGENIVVADDPAAFADAVVSLLDDPGRRAALGACGRRTVLAGSSWDRRAEEMERILEDVVASHAVPQRV